MGVLDTGDRDHLEVTGNIEALIATADMIMIIINPAEEEALLSSSPPLTLTIVTLAVTPAAIFELSASSAFKQ